MLFTFVTTTALHLEITRAVSAEEVLRFTARRVSTQLFNLDNFNWFKAADVKDFLTKKYNQMLIYSPKKLLGVLNFMSASSQL